MLESLRSEVLKANTALPRHGLVTLTWGNASAIDHRSGLVVIKPSGVDYSGMTKEDMVVVDLDGNVIEGQQRPSTDTPTHLALYRAFPQIGGVVHTHSAWATAWAQAQQEIPILGTTHADLSRYAIPVTRQLTEEEVEGSYEAATGTVLIEALGTRGPLELPCALVRGHGPFCWGENVAGAVHNAVTLEEVARMALLTRVLEVHAPQLDEHVTLKHFRRKHGEDAYYGQIAR
jgi:L-ribulose-5-phosphate 4-epimerase